MKKYDIYYWNEATQCFNLQRTVEGYNKALALYNESYKGYICQHEADGIGKIIKRFK